MIFRAFFHRIGFHSWKIECEFPEMKSHPSIVKTDLYGEATDEPASVPTGKKIVTYRCRICDKIMKKKVIGKIFY